MELKNNNQSSNINTINTNRFNVVVRIRPQLKLKNEEKKDLITEEDLFPCVTKLNEREIELERPNIEKRIFEFDRVIQGTSSQAETYNILGQKIVDDVLEGYNGTIMAYGQTGSGKTYTIFGTKKSIDYSEEILSDMGIVPRVIRQVFDHIKENEKKAIKIRAIFMQVYNETISDLIVDPTGQTTLSSNNLKRQSLKIREDPESGIYVEGLKQIYVTSEQELLNLIKHGTKSRITGSTSMNLTSSRSHAILQILIEQKWVENEKPEKKIKTRHYKKSLLTIVDLAGSERISKSGSGGDRLEEAKKINKSISSLGNCINSLANNSSFQHVPFRDSKLTRILTECLGGNSKTAIIACVSPYLMNFEETITTMQFASRAIRIKVDPHIFEKIDVKQLKEKLKSTDSLNPLNLNIGDTDKEDVYTVQGRKTDRKIDDQKIIEKILAGNKVSKKAAEKNDEETTNMVKKFHFMIIHLQNELAKKTIIINNLVEENKKLKENR